MYLLRTAAPLALWLAAVVTAHAACPPAGMDLPDLQALKTQRFEVADELRPALALGLLDCLAEPDPRLRDGIAYEALAGWLRADRLSPDLRRQLRDRLYATLDAPDADGFAAPFAALVLAEVARTDRIQPWMTPGERAGMVERAASWLAAVGDYRGYRDGEGWRHGVAHGADWVMQLAMNGQVDRAQLLVLLDAVAVQVVPAGGHAYVHGESARLARPVMQAARRGLLDAADWQDWFAALPARLGDQAAAYNDEAWLARRHDLGMFLLEINLQADRSSDEPARALKPLAARTLDDLP